MIPRYYKSRGVSPWIIKNPINQSTNHEQMRWKIIQSWQCPMGKSMLSNQLVYHHFPVLKISEIWGPSSSSSILSSTQRSYQAGSIPLRHPMNISHEHIPWTYPMNIQFFRGNPAMEPLPLAQSPQRSAAHVAPARLPGGRSWCARRMGAIKNLS